MDYAVKTILFHLCDGAIDFVQGEEESDKEFDSEVARPEATSRNIFKSAQKTNKVIFLSKSDLKSAFRILSILPHQCFLLIMKARNPLTKEFMFFVDKNLPFGASSSCSRFQLFSEALRHMVEHLFGAQYFCTCYLDDFLFISTEEQICNVMVRKFLEICEFIGCPVSHDKTEWASPVMVFLGILLDGRSHTLCVPEEKRVKALNLIRWAVE